MKKMVVIGIPIYKASLNQYEKISLQQVARVLREYPIVFIAPKSLIFNYGEEYEHWNIERFPDEFFQGTEAYSNLCLSISFYERFDNYKFLLIYQLDAFVFSDQLKKFCDMDYDYIGAPWPAFTINWRCTKSYVGNGGLSLRKIQSTLELLRERNPIKCIEKKDLFMHAEDIFFAYAGQQKIWNYRVAPSSVAVHFSIDYEVRKIYEKLSDNVPFGCHFWYKLNFSYWKPLIESFGYSFGEDEILCGSTMQEIRQEAIGDYFENRLLRSDVDKWLDKKSLKELYQRKRRYIVWGGGEKGKKYVRILQYIGVDIEKIFDRSKKNDNKKILGLKVVAPVIDHLQEKNIFVLITSKKYDEEIARDLLDYGLYENVDFFRYKELRNRLIGMYSTYFFYSVLKNGSL